MNTHEIAGNEGPGAVPLAKPIDSEQSTEETMPSPSSSTIQDDVASISLPSESTAVVIEEEDDDLKLDPKAPAYIPGVESSPWSSSQTQSAAASPSTMKPPLGRTVPPSNGNGSVTASTPNNKLQPIAEIENECDVDDVETENKQMNGGGHLAADNAVRSGYGSMAPQTASTAPNGQSHQTPSGWYQMAEGMASAVPVGPAPLQRANSMPNLMVNGRPHSNHSMSNGVGVPIPLLAPNILDQNQIALQLQNVVNQNIISTNTMNFVTNSNGNDSVTVTLTPRQCPPPRPLPPGPLQQPIHRLSATPTLLNVADGVIPGVEAGLYWYHPQIDQSAVLLPVVVNQVPPPTPTAATPQMEPSGPPSSVQTAASTAQTQATPDRPRWAPAVNHGHGHPLRLQPQPQPPPPPPPPSGQ